MSIEPASFLRFDSSGEVRRSDFLDERGKKPVRGGLLCPQIWPSPDAEGWGHIAVPLGVVHPAHAAAIGARLGLSAEDVLAVARGEGWLDGGAVQRGEVMDETQLDASFAGGLVAADPSVEEWIVRRVPVLAPAQRPPRRMAGGGEVPDPVGFAYVSFINVKERAQRLHELKAPEMIVALMRARAQAAFEALIDALDGRVRTPWRELASLRFAVPVVKARAKPKAAPRRKARKGARPLTCGAAVVGEAGILVSRGDETALLARPGEEPRRYATPSLIVRAVSDDGRTALLTHARAATLHLLDLDNGVWLETGRDDFPRGLVRQEADDSFVVDVPRRRERPVGRHPALAVSSPDQRFVWVADPLTYGGIYECASGELVAWPVLGWLEATEDSDPADDAIRHVGAAFVCTPRDRFRFFTGGRVIEGDAERELPDGIDDVLAAAFDRTGDRLLVITADAALVLALDAEVPALVARYEL